MYKDTPNFPSCIKKVYVLTLTYHGRTTVESVNEYAAGASDYIFSIMRFLRIPEEKARYSERNGVKIYDVLDHHYEILEMEVR